MIPMGQPVRLYGAPAHLGTTERITYWGTGRIVGNIANESYYLKPDEPSRPVLGPIEERWFVFLRDT